jgi:hypothetical protein
LNLEKEQREEEGRGLLKFSNLDDIGGILKKI